MSEARMVELVQGALEARGIEDQVVAAGQFNPRGHTGGLFVGGLLGGDAGSALGGIGAASAWEPGPWPGCARPTPPRDYRPTCWWASPRRTVYGFAAPTRHDEPTALAFEVRRDGLTTKVHQGVNVRVLELIDDASGSRIELEGNRLPVTHSKDVIEALRG